MKLVLPKMAALAHRPVTIALALAVVLAVVWAAWASLARPAAGKPSHPAAAAASAPAMARSSAAAASHPSVETVTARAAAAPQAALQAAPADPLPTNAAPTATPAFSSQALGCLIEASAVADVGTPVIGVIEEVLVERGDPVQRGQELARHENRVERAAVTLAQQKVANTAELRAARSQISFADKKAERTATLTELNFVSGQAREQAETEAEMARMRLAQAVEQRELALKELEMARAQLQQRTLVSPLTGVVVDRLVSPGERVENRPVFRIAQIDPLRVEVVLPSALFGRIAVGAVARVVPDLPGSPPHEARVTIVDRVVDAGSNTFRARLSLPNPDQQLPAGVRCRVEFGS